MSFESYLQELADPAKPLAVSKLVKLSSLGPDEASLFLDRWPELDLRRRQRLVHELTDLAEDNVELNFDAVFFIALGDAGADVRRDAIRGLWEYEGCDLIDPLQGLLQHDPDAGVRAEAALALGPFVLQAEFDSLRAADVERVERTLRRAVEDTHEVSEVRGRALEALGARSQPWVRDLIQGAFESADRRLRLSAVHAMGRSCDAAWLPTITPELASEDGEMRFEAASACGDIGDEAAIPHLLPLLYDEDQDAQEAAVNALGKIGGLRAKQALEELLEGADARVREAVLSALAEMDFEEDPLGFRVRQ